MRMVHYYLALALVVAPTLVGAVLSGFLAPGSRVHATLGLFGAISCVAIQTLLILFMIVTGRVLKAAVASRSLPGEYLVELNEFFAHRPAYPLALLGAVLAVATAVLGYGDRIGVPQGVHALLGTATLLAHVGLLPAGVWTLRRNQSLLDRVAAELDRIDAERSRAGAPPVADAPEPWAFSPAVRWAIFALAAWLPYAYWGLVVWRGRFGEIPAGLPVACGVASAFGLFRALRSGARS